MLLAIALVVTGCSDDERSDDSDAGAEVREQREAGAEVGGTAEPGGPVAWPAPPPAEVASLADAAGVPLETQEHLAHHVHAHLDVFIDGEHQTVPAGIGIVIDDPGVRSFDDPGGTSYGGIEGCDTGCISPLHTHDVSGVIHTESPTEVDNTLGQLFALWDVELTATCIAEHCTPKTAIGVYVDGTTVPLAEAADIALLDGTEVAVVIGDSPSQIPDEGDFSAA